VVIYYVTVCKSENVPCICMRKLDSCINLTVNVVLIKGKRTKYRFLECPIRRKGKVVYIDEGSVMNLQKENTEMLRIERSRNYALFINPQKMHTTALYAMYTWCLYSFCIFRHSSKYLIFTKIHMLGRITITVC
jgi:hypothetical protein